MKNIFPRFLTRLPLEWCLALMVAINGYLFLYPVLLRLFAYMPEIVGHENTWKNTLSVLGLLELPRFILGLGLILIAVGLLLKARVAWAFSLLLLMAISIFSLWETPEKPLITLYSVCLILILLYYWHRFDHASLAAGSLFASICFTSLLLYAVFGSLYLGEEFHPAILDIPTALYFAVVSMSTVGFGDIVPHTSTARLFTASVIVMGITLFATSISAIIGSMIGENLKRMVKGRISHVMRKNHFIIAGASPLALSVYQGLKQRGDSLTVIVPPNLPHNYPIEADLIIGDASNTNVLTEAGAAKAKYILALRSDDADNAFIILAAKEVANPNTKTISVVNDSEHLPKIKRVGPDMVFSLQLMGSELLIRTLTGESIDHQLITELFLGGAKEHSSPLDK